MKVLDKPANTLPKLASREDVAYLDFVEGLRKFDVKTLEPVLRRRGQEALEEFERRQGRRPATLADTKAALDGVPFIQTKWRVRRCTQEMSKRRVMAAFAREEAERLAELDRTDRSGPGSVEWDPNFSYPEYFKRDFHLQPGGYWEDPLAGYWYHYGTKVFYQGENDEDQMHRAQVKRVPAPADGQVQRVLDLACSCGQSTTAFKERFPEAEVWGIDPGAPMVRYSHKRAVDMGLDVHFAQRLAEDTKFPDGWFDVVYAHILFHEIPADIAKRVVREAHRVLRPGGIFAVLDFANFSPEENPLGMHIRYMDQTYNEEPYSCDFVHSDFTGLLESVFAKVDDGHGAFLPLRVCEK